MLTGTQIEGARPHTTADGSSAYADYSPQAASFYMDRTREWVQRARRQRRCDDSEQHGRVEL